MEIAKVTPGPFHFAGSTKFFDFLERVLIYGSIALIPYDLPVFHEACLPLAGLGIFLMLARDDLRPFLAYLRRLPAFTSLAIMVCILSISSLYGNLGEILNSAFQQESGWSRGTMQAILLVLNFFFPFYLAFCLRRRADWQSMVIRAAWWSLPIPLLVGFFQFANFLGIPGTAHLPYVMAYERGVTVFRITTVSRESSWFGSYTCVILPFLMIGIANANRRWLKWVGAGATAIVLLFFFLGFSKSAYVALVSEIGVGGGIILFVRRSWQMALTSLYWVLIVCTAAFSLSILAPQQWERIAKPFVSQAIDVYNVFEPLLLGNTKTNDIGSRFGMLDAGISMAEAHPVLGVGLGQFGYHAYNYLPIWGLTAETEGWVANDTSAWPSTSNLYARLWAETGGVTTLAYLVFRLLIMQRLGIRLLRRYDPDWWRNLAVFSVLVALVAFDFHRDSFINMDMWATLGMALACLSRAGSEERAQNVRVDRIWPFSGIVALLAFCIPLTVVVLMPVTYKADATIIPKSDSVLVSPDEPTDGTGPTVNRAGDVIPTARFKLIRTFLSSRVVGARMIANHQNLLQAVFKKKHISPAEVAQYINDNVTILMADSLTTLTLEYRNSDPNLATKFLTATIEETDHAVTAASALVGTQVARLSQTVLQGNLDSTARAALLNSIAAQELESSFDTVSENASFDYINRPAVSLSTPSPQPGPAILFTLLLAGFTASIVTVVRVLWPSHIQGFERLLLRLLSSRRAIV